MMMKSRIPNRRWFMFLPALLALSYCLAAPAQGQRLAEIHLKYDNGTEQSVPVPPPPTTAPATLPPFVVSPSQAGLASFFDGRPCLPDDQRTHYAWTWNFGDDSPPMQGFNSAHIYEKPGTYTVTLTVTREHEPEASATGQGDLRQGDTRQGDKETSRSVSLSVTIPPSTRRVVNVPPGTDLGLYDRSANLELVLAKNATYTSTHSMYFLNNVLLRGNGSTLNFPRPTAGFLLYDNCRITGLTFDYPAAADPKTASHDDPVNMCIMPHGKYNAVDHCTFLNVAYAVNGNANPDGVLVQDCSAPLMGGLRGYLCWVQGKAWVIDRNTAANSTIEHIVRCEFDSGPLAITNNTFSNLSAAQSKVANDTPKGCILLHWTHDVYIHGNTITGLSMNGGGDVGLGPLTLTITRPGQTMPNPERVVRTVVEDNKFIGAYLGVDAGAIDAVLRDNTFGVAPIVTWKVGAAIRVNATDPERKRDVENLRIHDNTCSAPYEPLTIRNGQVRDLVSDWKSR